MTKLSRRGYLKLVGFLGAVAALPKSIVQAAEPLPVDEPLDYVRDLNSAEAAYRRKFQRYASAEQMVQSPRYATKQQRAVPPGWEVLVALLGDAEGYRIRLRRVDGGLEYHTDHLGVIYEGTGSHPMKGVVAESDTLRPIVPPSQRTGSRSTSLFNRMLALVVPTLHAEEACVCGSCLGPGQCGGQKNLCTGGQTCCNLGYKECTWCCGYCTC
jgi:hypothetical protein